MALRPSTRHTLGTEAHQDVVLPPCVAAPRFAPSRAQQARHSARQAVDRRTAGGARPALADGGYSLDTSISKGWTRAFSVHSFIKFFLLHKSMACCTRAGEEVSRGFSRPYRVRLAQSWSSVPSAFTSTREVSSSLSTMQQHVGSQCNCALPHVTTCLASEPDQDLAGQRRSCSSFVKNIRGQGCSLPQALQCIVRLRQALSWRRRARLPGHPLRGF